MVAVIIVIVIAYVAIVRIVNQVNWTIVIPVTVAVIAATIIIIRLIKKKQAAKSLIIPEKVITSIDVNAPVELSGAYKCQACGAVTIIKKTDTVYVCKFCDTKLLEAEKDAEQVRRERRLANQDLDKLRELEHEKHLKSLELEQERLKTEAKKRDARSEIAAYVFLGVLGFGMIAFFLFMFLSNTGRH